jgi:beta-phosphoglucomutase-like phosphatase (HAD superfamily)
MNPAILFDLDGTLVDTAYQHVLAWSAALKSAGILVPHGKIHRRIGIGGKSLVRQVVREHGRQNRRVNIETLENKHDTFFNSAGKEFRSLPGARDLLRRLTQLGVRWAIATTGGRSQTKGSLENCAFLRRLSS